MHSLSKIFNKKLSGKLLGVKSPYSISFINCQMDWYEVPLLKKIVKKNYPAIDHVMGIPASYGQIKSDVILRVFANPTSSDIAKDFKGFQEDDFINSKNINELLLPIVGALRIRAGNYKITKVDNILIGENKNKVLRITGMTEHGLEATNFNETVFVFTPSSLLIFDLNLMDRDEPKADIIKSDFLKILNSIKL